MRYPLMHMASSDLQGPHENVQIPQRVDHLEDSSNSAGFHDPWNVAIGIDTTIHISIGEVLRACRFGRARG